MQKQDQIEEARKALAQAEAKWEEWDERAEAAEFCAREDRERANQYKRAYDLACARLAVLLRERY